MIGRIVPIVVISVLATVTRAQQPVRPEAKWNNPPAAAAPGVEHRSYRSKSMDTEVGYSVWLPPGYAEGKQRYPVIYFLHGAGGNENSDAGGFSGLVSRLVEEKAIKPAICVFANGGMGGYRDNPDRHVMGETMIVKELVPLIDRTLRTKRDRASRVICGFSMGGGGAARLALKHPDLFSAAASWAGVPQPMRDGIVPELDAEAVRKLDGRVRLLLIEGDKDMTYEAQKPFTELLQQVGYPVTYRVLPGVSHDLGKYYELTGADLVKFLAEKW